MGRGKITMELRDKAKELLDIEISIIELRLIPYIQFLLVNQQRIQPNKINQDEREILSSWRKKGWLVGGAGGDLEVSKEFWDAMHELLWISYVVGA